jgi:hypothetical protein
MTLRGTGDDVEEPGDDDESAASHDTGLMAAPVAGQANIIPVTVRKYFAIPLYPV